MTTIIRIPEKVYVGFQGRRGEDEVPLGFMTPFTTDEAGAKRVASVDRWASGGYRQTKKFNSVTLENKPMIGFKVGRAIRRSGSWGGGGASYIRIEDPRGFELEITIENLTMCMIGNIIEDGEIIQECVWGRDGNKNILLTTNSEPFLNSVQTDSNATVVPLKSIKPGATPNNQLQLESKQYVIKQTDRNGVESLSHSATIKVGKIISSADTKLTPEEVEEIVKRVRGCSVRGSRVATFSTSKKFTIENVEHETVNVRDIEKAYSDDSDNAVNQFDDVAIFGETSSGEFVTLYSYYNFAGNNRNPAEYTVEYVQQSGDEFVSDFGRNKGSGYHNYKQLPKSDIVRFFVRKINFKTEIGTTHSTWA